MTAALDRAAFLAARRKGIGGSDVAAILGISKYKTAEQLWLEKTGQATDDDGDNYHKRRGRMFEPVIKQLYADAHPELVLDQTIGQREHPEFPWMLANYDAISYGDTKNLDIMPRIVEIKAPSIGAYRKIQREGMKEEWIVQMQHYLAVSGLSLGTFVVFCAELCEQIEFDVRRDPGMIEMLIEREREFWTLVETMTPPPTVVREFADAPPIEQVGTVTKRHDDDFLDAVRALREATELCDTADALKAEARARVLELAESKPGIYETPNARIYYTVTKGRASFEKAKLAAARPLDPEKVKTVLDQYGASPDRIDEALAECALDLARFEKVGAAGTQFKVYFLGGAA